MLPWQVYSTRMPISQPAPISSVIIPMKSSWYILLQIYSQMEYLQCLRLVSDPMHHVFISSITFWDALNGPKRTKGNAWVRTRFCKVVFFGGEENTVGDVVVSLASALGPEHMELVFVLPGSSVQKNVKPVGYLSHSCILNFHFHIKEKGRK